MLSHFQLHVESFYCLHLLARTSSSKHLQRPAKHERKITYLKIATPLVGYQHFFLDFWNTTEFINSGNVQLLN